MSLRMGIIGTGYLGSRRAEKAAQLERATLVGVYDLDPSRSAEVASRLGCRQFRQLDLLLEGIDAAVVAVPAHDHERVATRVIEAGRSALVEKPLAATVEQAARLVHLARERDVVLQVGHVERFNPAFEAASGLVTAPRFIEVHRLSPFVSRGLDTDVVLEVMIHDLELLQALVRQPVVTVEAVGVPVVSDSNDIANARLTFANGCVANLTASRVAAVRQRKLRIFQPGEYLSVDLDTRQISRVTPSTVDSPGQLESLPVFNDSRDALTQELQAFVDSIFLRTRPRVSGEAGLAALELAQRVLEAVRASLVRA